MIGACSSADATFPPRLLNSDGAPTEPAASGSSGTGASSSGGVVEGPTAAGSSGVTPTGDPLIASIAALPHVKTVVEFVEPADARRPQVPVGYRRFDVEFEQLADHAQPRIASNTFSQRLSVLHKVSGTSAAVLSTSGYMLSAYRSELTRLYGTNEICIEHRFFQKSTPGADSSAPDWSLDTIAQSAADFHEITLAFKKLYPGKWVNTGASKGGETVVYHRRFFPGDVDGTVAYVAPNVFGVEDPRFSPYIEQVGGAAFDDCRAKLRTFQRAMLQRRDELKAFTTGKFDRLGGYDVAIEHAAIEVPFAFFQYGAPENDRYGCAAIPAADATADVLSAFLDQVGALDGNYDDVSMQAFDPYYAQAALELGNYTVNLVPLSDLLHHAETYKTATYVPGTFHLAFRPEPMHDVATWVKSDATQMLFVYGEYDPWSAAAYEVPDGQDATRQIARITVKGANHGASLGWMDDTQRTRALALTNAWFGATPTPAAVHAQLRETRPLESPRELRDRLHARPGTRR